MENNLTPEQVVEKINEKFNETLATMPTKEDLDGLKSDVEVLKGLEAKSQEIEKAIARFEGKMEAISEKGFKSERKARSLGEAISMAYVANIDKIKETAEKGGMMSLETKAILRFDELSGPRSCIDFVNAPFLIISLSLSILSNLAK